MKTTCTTCGKSDESDLMYWGRDAEGNWHHRACYRREQERVLERVQSLRHKERERP